MIFNSLDAQREACSAYIACQRSEGWVELTDQYDDGGSGGPLRSPVLKRLMAYIEAGRVDVVMAYKIDRLSRVLMDFAQLVEVGSQQRHRRRHRRSTDGKFGPIEAPTNSKEYDAHITRRSRSLRTKCLGSIGRRAIKCYNRRGC